MNTSILSENQKLLLYWIVERDNIRNAKEMGLDPPWTSNPVMQTVYFTNVNREDDKVTKWIRRNWLYTNSEYFHIDMIVARIFNLPSTLELIGQPTKFVFKDWLHKTKELLHELSDRKKPIWNGAYIISTAGRKMSKIDYCIEIIEAAHNQGALLRKCVTLAEAHKALMGIHGLASFLAAQVVADLKQYSEYHLYSADDKSSFSAFGPGSLRGLSWFWEDTVVPNNYRTKIREAYVLISPYLPKSILKILDMQNFQNCFCEFDKFMRVRSGKGRSKRIYKHGTKIS